MSLAADPTLFEAMITPHRSLTARVGRRIAFAMGAVAGLMSAVFAIIGAWPVLGFCGVEIGIAATLLVLHARAGRVSERVLLSERALVIVRTDARGRRAVCELPASWLSVRLEERAGVVPRLLVRQRRREVEIARVLGEAEKREVAAALSGAVERLRSPIFDNPQLRPAEVQPFP